MVGGGERAWGTENPATLNQTLQTVLCFFCWGGRKAAAVRLTDELVSWCFGPSQP